MGNEEIIFFEQEIRNEKIRTVYTMIFVVASFICILQAVFRVPVFYLGNLLNIEAENFEFNQTLYFYLQPFLSIVLNSVALFFPFWVFTKLSSFKLKDYFTKHEDTPFLWKVLSPVAVTGVSIGILYASLIVKNLLIDRGFVFNEEYISTGNDIFQKIFYLALFTLIPAFTDELVFRGIVLQFLRKHGVTAAVCISAAICAFSHISIEKIPYLLIAGLFLGWFYVKTENLKLTVISHMVLNICMGLINIFRDTVAEEEFMQTIQLIAITAFIVGLGAFILLILKYKFKLQDRQDPENELFKAKESLTGIFKTFAVYVFIFITVFQIFFIHVKKPEAEEEELPGEVVEQVVEEE